MGVQFDGAQWTGPSTRSLKTSSEKYQGIIQRDGVESERLQKYDMGYTRWLSNIEKFT